MQKILESGCRSSETSRIRNYKEPLLFYRDSSLGYEFGKYKE